MDADALWRHRIANAIHQVEKPAAMERIQKSGIFQKEAKKAVRLHREIVVLSGEACYKSQSTAIVGCWTAQDKGKASVVGMPSLQRYPNIEAQLATLGKLLAFGLNAMFFSVGPGRGKWRLVWCDDDGNELDISSEDDLIALLLDLRTERATDQRYYEVTECLKLGRLPPRQE